LRHILNKKFVEIGQRRIFEIRANKNYEAKVA